MHLSPCTGFGVSSRGLMYGFLVSATAPFTTCHQPLCPELVEIGGCWCWEHLSVCHEPELDCEQPAHLCDEPVHYCERHALVP